MSIFNSLAVSIAPKDVKVPAVQADQLLPGILSTVYWVAGIAAVVVIVVAGIFYSISEGDAAKVKRAKDAIIFSLVGLGVIFAAFIITNFITGRIV